MKLLSVKEILIFMAFMVPDGLPRRLCHVTPSPVEQENIHFPTILSIVAIILTNSVMHYVVTRGGKTGERLSAITGHKVLEVLCQSYSTSVVGSWGREAGCQ